MPTPHPLCTSLLGKIHEQIERTSHLVELVPPGSLEWKPPAPGAWPVGLLLGHLLECAAGFCAVLAAAEPGRLAHFGELRNLPVNHACSPGDVGTRLALYRGCIGEGFALLDDARLAQMLPTVFVQDGEPLLTLLLGNLEHLINHKHQLFTYLKLMGVEVTTADLYRFRGEPPTRGAAPARPSIIRIVAALVQDAAGRVLLVRKRGTMKFMQPGGKPRDSEPQVAALKRELREELLCAVQDAGATFLGTFHAPAAHEEGCVVEAEVYRVELAGPITAGAEIEEVLWLDPTPPYPVELAPLTRDKVLPLARTAAPMPRRS